MLPTSASGSKLLAQKKRKGRSKSSRSVQVQAQTENPESAAGINHNFIIFLHTILNYYRTITDLNLINFPFESHTETEIPWKTRDIFTDGIFECFADIEMNDGINCKARCTLCDENCPTNIKSFAKGNTSNLKTHLKRVSTT